MWVRLHNIVCLDIFGVVGLGRNRTANKMSSHLSCEQSFGSGLWETPSTFPHKPLKPHLTSNFGAELLLWHNQTTPSDEETESGRHEWQALRLWLSHSWQRRSWHWHIWRSQKSSSLQLGCSNGQLWLVTIWTGCDYRRDVSLYFHRRQEATSQQLSGPRKCSTAGGQWSEVKTYLMNRVQGINWATTDTITFEHLWDY